MKVTRKRARRTRLPAVRQVVRNESTHAPKATDPVSVSMNKLLLKSVKFCLLRSCDLLGINHDNWMGPFVSFFRCVQYSASILS